MTKMEYADKGKLGLCCEMGMRKVMKTVRGFG